MSTAAPPELRPLPGPTALGGGRSRFFELLLLVSVTEFKRSYFGTVLGYFWSLLRPLMLFAILLVVFTKVFRIGSGVEAYPVLLLFNIVVFGFFQESTTIAVQSIVNQESIVRKTQFPRLVIPLSVVVTALLNLTVNLIAVFAFILAYGVDPQWTWLLLPVILGLLFVFTTAVAMGISALFVRYRDVAIIWSVLVTALFYGTPVLYPFEKVPAGFGEIVQINPLMPVFQQARAWIIDPDAEGAVDAAGGLVELLPAVAIFVAVCVLGVWIFRREAPRIAEDL